MKFDDFYRSKGNYFSTQQSDGMQVMIEKYNVKPSRALDIGAGEGRNSIYLAKLGFDVVAVELREEIRKIEQLEGEADIQMLSRAMNIANSYIEENTYTESSLNLLKQELSKAEAFYNEIISDGY